MKKIFMMIALVLCALGTAFADKYYNSESEFYRMYTMLKDEVFRMEKHPNYMTVPAAIRELEKIEMVRGLDGRYRMDHAVTATQKDILRAFHLDAAAVKKQADELSEMLNKYDRQTLEEQ